MSDIPKHKVLEHETIQKQCEVYFTKKEAQKIEQGKTAEGKLKLEKSERKVLNRPLRGL